MGKKEKGAKKATKKKRQAVNISKAIIPDSTSDKSDNELPDYGNGQIDTTLKDFDDKGWISDDDRELIEKVKTLSQPNDRINYKTKLKQLNWNEIAFKHFTAKDCENRFADHLKHVRRYRNLNEVATDIGENIKKSLLKKPLNSYQIFIQDQLVNATTSGDFAATMKNLAMRYKELKPEERSVYDKKAAQLREENRAQKSAYNIGKKSNSKSNVKAKTPFLLFFENNPENAIYSEMREKYANLPLDEKYKWVIKAVSLAPEKNVKDFLNKDEQRILNGQVKAPLSAYALFVKGNYNKFKETHDGKDAFIEVARQWKSLDADKKQTYIDAAAILKENADKEQDEFNARHGLTKPVRKRRQSVYVERPIERSSDQEEEEEVSEIQSKKRKASESSAIESASSFDNTKIKQNKIKSPTKYESSKQNSESPPLAPVRSVEMKKSDSMSETSEYNEPTESDAASSSTSTSFKKKQKKDKKDKKMKIIEPPTGKPPSSLFKYFAQEIHTGRASKAQKAFDLLTKKEVKKLSSEYNDKVETFVHKLKKYINTLSMEDARAYINKVQAADQANKQSDEDSSQE